MPKTPPSTSLPTLNLQSTTEPTVCAAATHACLGSGVFVFDTTTSFSLIFPSRSGNCSAFSWVSFCQPPKETLPQSLSSFHFCLLLLLSLLACWGSKSNISNFKKPHYTISENDNVLKVCKSMKRQKTTPCLPFPLCTASAVKKPVTNAGAAVGGRREISPCPWNRGDSFSGFRGQQQGGITLLLSTMDSTLINGKSQQRIYY